MRAPVAATPSEVIALTVPAVPTGMNTGVSTAPCAVVRRPRRAAPSRANTSKPITFPLYPGSRRKAEKNFRPGPRDYTPPRISRRPRAGRCTLILDLDGGNPLIQTDGCLAAGAAELA